MTTSQKQKDRFKKRVLRYLDERTQQIVGICPFITRVYVEGLNKPLGKDADAWIGIVRLSDWNTTIYVSFPVLFLNLPDRNLRLLLANKKYLDAGLCHEAGHTYLMDICNKSSDEVEQRAEAIGILIESELNRRYGVLMIK